MAGRTVRRPNGRLVRGLFLALLAGAGTFALALEPTPAGAQAWVGVPPRGANKPLTASSTLANRQRDPNAQMLVQANEIHYDYTGDQVSAVGGVQIHYGGSVLEADRVIYNQKAKRLFAEGNVRLTEADGKVVTADRLDLDEQFRNGFVDSLHLETAEKTRLSAARADVAPGSGEQGRVTVFQSGTYTACEPCKENPARPPKWQVRAARIIHDEAEKTIFYEDARLEFFGVPVAYMPYFWTPDPTVKKKSGFLMPRIISGTFIGNGVQVPYFWNIAPDYDLTFAPAYFSRQGLLAAGEWRQRLMNGAYAIRASGIVQQDQAAFAHTVGDREFRGAIETKGDFRLAQNWWAGWNASLFSDNQYAPHYKVTRQGQEAVSQAYLFGRGTFSYLDLRAVHFYGFSPLDVQKQLSVLHPVLDYKYRFADPILGGEVTVNANLTSLSRQQADFDARETLANQAVCDSIAAIKTTAQCLLRGIPGTYTRGSVEAQWRKTIIDPFGQIFTPFLLLRADAASMSISPETSVSNFIQTGDYSAGRLTPAVGLDYRYPLISAHSWGTQIIEPRVQVIARPNEQNIRRFPNEDSQALLFDDANLFAISKFPGWDRVEGGGRANVGVQYTAQFNQGGYVNALFGQSYQLFGANSYAAGDMANTGLQSGLENNVSDFVARATYKPNSTYTFNSRFRFDEQNFDIRRMEFEGRVAFERWTASVTYGKYDAQPNVGMILPREGIMPAATLKLSPNWHIGGSALYSLDSAQLNTISVNAGYIDECIAVSAIYSENYGYNGSIVPNRIFMFQVSLRTLGGSNLMQTAGGPGGGGTSF